MLKMNQERFFYVFFYLVVPIWSLPSTPILAEHYNNHILNDAVQAFGKKTLIERTVLNLPQHLLESKANGITSNNNQTSSKQNERTILMTVIAKNGSQTETRVTSKGKDMGNAEGSTPIRENLFANGPFR